MNNHCLKNTINLIILFALLTTGIGCNKIRQLQKETEETRNREIYNSISGLYTNQKYEAREIEPNENELTVKHYSWRAAKINQPMRGTLVDENGGLSLSVWNEGTLFATFATLMISNTSEKSVLTEHSSEVDTNNESDFIKTTVNTYNPDGFTALSNIYKNKTGLYYNDRTFYIVTPHYPEMKVLVLWTSPEYQITDIKTGTVIYKDRPLISIGDKIKHFEDLYDDFLYLNSIPEPFLNNPSIGQYISPKSFSDSPIDLSHACFKGKSLEEYLTLTPLGENGLFEAVKTRNYKLLDFLLRYNIDVNITNLDGQTPVMVHGYGLPYDLDIIEILIHNGADISIIDNYGKNLSYYADLRQTANQRTIKYLESERLSPVNNHGKSHNGIVLESIQRLFQEVPDLDIEYYENGNIKNFGKLETEWSIPLLEIFGSYAELFYDLRGNIIKIVSTPPYEGPDYGIST